MWCSPVQFRFSLPRQLTNKNHHKQSWNPSIPDRSMDGMYSISENIYFVCKCTSCKWNSNVFPICCGLHVTSVCITWVGANLTLIGNLHPLVTVTGRMPCINFKSEYYRNASQTHLCYRLDDRETYHLHESSFSSTTSFHVWAIISTTILTWG